jgi:hypothetical protein
MVQPCLTSSTATAVEAAPPLIEAIILAVEKLKKPSLAHAVYT